MADAAYARAVAGEFVDGLLRAGTTTALVFGAHFRAAVDALFERAAEVGLRISSGLVVSDRLLRPELLTTPEQAYAEGLALAARWHRTERPAALRRHPALLAVGERRAARVVRGRAPRRRRGAVHLAHQREHRRDRDRPRPLPGLHRLHRHLPPVRAARPGQRAGAQRASRRRGAGPARRGRARPSRTARRATARWAAACSRCAATSSAACGWRWARTSAPGRLLAAPRGVAGVLRAVAARRRRPAADARAPAVPGDAGRRGRAGPRRRRSATCRWGGSSTRSGSVPDDGGTLDVVLAPRDRRGRRAGEGVRAGRARRTCAGCGWAATGSAEGLLTSLSTVETSFSLPSVDGVEVGRRPEGVDRDADLADVLGAAVAVGQVRLDTDTPVGREDAVEVVGHEVDELPAGQVVQRRSNLARRLTHRWVLDDGGDRSGHDAPDRTPRTTCARWLRCFPTATGSDSPRSG